MICCGHFQPPMLCERLTDPRRLADRRYIAEPKLDGQRAQLHVQHGEAVACFSRHGLDLLRHPGMAWLRSIASHSSRRSSTAKRAPETDTKASRPYSPNGAVSVGTCRSSCSMCSMCRAAT
jgi:hypothetical protein